MVFWIIAAALALGVAALVIIPLRRTEDALPHSSNDIAIYKDQLAEVERDLARGVLDPEEAERTRTEIARRLLAADRAAKEASAAETHTSKTTVILVGAAVFAMSVLGYFGTAGILKSFGVSGATLDQWRQATTVGHYTHKGEEIAISPVFFGLGAPGYSDMPRGVRLADAQARMDARPSQAEAEAAQPPREQVELPESLQATVDRVRQRATDNPTDQTALRDLVRLESAMGNMDRAAHAQVELVKLGGTNAAQEDLEILLELLIQAAGGEVTPEAENVLVEVIRRDNDSITGLYWAGLMFSKYGRPDRAFPYWKRLLEVAPADAPWLSEITTATVELAWYAGVDDYTPPAPMLRGPTGEDIAAAADMSAGDQQEMIQGMVNRLMDRLGAEGGTPEEWAQLIRALGVLGDTERATAIWGEAQQKYGQTPEALAIIREAAVGAGVAQ